MFADGIAYFSIPYDIRDNMNSTDFKVLYCLFDLLHIRSKRRPHDSIYVTPSEMWIGKRCQLSRETVSRSISRLTLFGLISRTRRRKLKGVWQCNLYKIGYRLARIAKSARQFASDLFNHVTQNSHIVPISKYNYYVESKKEVISKVKDPELQSIIDRCKQKANF
jgi:hypothetical protein